MSHSPSGRQSVVRSRVYGSGLGQPFGRGDRFDKLHFGSRCCCDSDLHLVFRLRNFSATTDSLCSRGRDDKVTAPCDDGSLISRSISFAELAADTSETCACCVSPVNPISRRPYEPCLVKCTVDHEEALQTGVNPKPGTFPESKAYSFADLGTHWG